MDNCSGSRVIPNRNDDPIFIICTYTCTYTYVYIYITKPLFEKEEWQTMNSFEKWELETTKIVAHSPCCGHGFPIFNAEISFIWELARRICYMKPSHIIYVFIVCSFFKSSARFCRCLWIPSNQTWQRKTPRFWSENHGKSSSPLEKLQPHLAHDVSFRRRLQARGPAANHHRSGAVQAMRPEPWTIGADGNFPRCIGLTSG
jgi:hypothetical protein